MKNYPLVSIILPTFNRAGLLPKAIESAFLQTYKNFELIIVDDCSHDETSSLLKTYGEKDSRIVAIHNEKNLGLVKSLNKGIQYAKGKYIARLDDDDFWCDPQKLEKQVVFLEKKPEYVLVGGGQIRIDEKGKEIARYEFPETDKAIRNYILRNNPFSHTSVMFRKETWEKAGGYNESLIFSEDWDLWMRFLLIGEAYNFKEYFVCYIEGTQNRSNEHMARDAFINIKLRMKYRKNFPYFCRAFVYGFFALGYAFLPFKKGIRAIVNLHTCFLHQK